ncbi:hypothetical protein ACFOON_15085 [Novosphingobium piscinae]|uniref:Uncharacterized protein n=1 Tax=Novosphingobium piscinae TaxID=1507448 RepID=A0A7X1KPT5_9SPHN|nr:hypothetical protein [Novosphingobium piscinae]MBC2668775.1 hypothetical protein [Novosphingobium piscinae]
MSEETREWAIEAADLADAWREFMRHIECIDAFKKPMALAFEAGFKAGRAPLPPKETEQ